MKNFLAIRFYVKSILGLKTSKTILTVKISLNRFVLPTIAIWPTVVFTKYLLSEGNFHVFPHCVMLIGNFAPIDDYIARPFWYGTILYKHTYIWIWYVITMTFFKIGSFRRFYLISQKIAVNFFCNCGMCKMNASKLIW